MNMFGDYGFQIPFRGHSLASMGCHVYDVQMINRLNGRKDAQPHILVGLELSILSIAFSVEFAIRRVTWQCVVFPKKQSPALESNQIKHSLERAEAHLLDSVDDDYPPYPIEVDVFARHEGAKIDA